MPGPGQWWAVWAKPHCFLLTCVFPGPRCGLEGEAGDPTHLLSTTEGQRALWAPGGGCTEDGLRSSGPPPPGCPHPSAHLPCPHCQSHGCPQTTLENQTGPHGSQPGLAHRRPQPKTCPAGLWLILRSTDTAASETGLSCKRQGLLSTGSREADALEDAALRSLF